MPAALDRLDLLHLLQRVAETGSLTAAGRLLGLSQPSASRQLRALEDLLGAQLVTRSTHELALTDAGAAALEAGRSLLAAWEGLAEAAGGEQRALAGLIRVAAPLGLGQGWLVDVAAAFLREHPGVRLDWRLAEEPGDLAAGGYDLWLRVGPVADQALIVRPLRHIERGLVATAASGLCATHPDEASGLPAVVLSPYVGAQVALTGPDGATAVLVPRAVASTDHLFAAERLMMAGLGYAILPLWLVAGGLASGRVVRLCPTWSPPAVTLSAVLPPARHRPARVRAFVEHVRGAAGGNAGPSPWSSERLARAAAPGARRRPRAKRKAAR